MGLSADSHLLSVPQLTTSQIDPDLRWPLLFMYLADIPQPSMAMVKRKVMNTTHLLTTAYNIAMASDPELHKKWISISHKLGSIAGVAHLMPLQRIGRLDMMLRLLEGERLEIMKSEPSHELEISLDLQFSLSESWIFSSYEVARAAKKPFLSQ